MNGASMPDLWSELSKFHRNNFPVPTVPRRCELFGDRAVGGVCAVYCLEDAGTCTEVIPLPFVGWKTQLCPSLGGFAHHWLSRHSRTGSGVVMLCPQAQLPIPTQVIN